MYIHIEKKIAFIAHPRTASREVAYNVLMPRGFVRFMGHHGVPWSLETNRHGKADMVGPFYDWWQANPLEWTFYAGHRNHFETFHSIGCAALGGRPPEPARFLEYIWKHPGLYHNVGVLFPSFFAVAGCRELRFAHLRDDVAAMLERHDLGALRPDELIREESENHTNAKPRDQHYSQYLDPLCRQWIEGEYGLEMRRFGYTWEDAESPVPAEADTGQG